MLKRLNTFNSQDIELNRLMDNLDLALNPVFGSQILDYSLIQNVSLKIGQNTIDHKLGRAPIGWFITRQKALANLHDTQDSNTTPTKNYLLNSDAVVTVDVYFF